MVDLSKCKPGDKLISSQGTILEYVSPTPWGAYTYLDHVVKYVQDKDGTEYSRESYGTRTNDGYVFAKHRIPATDDDIIQIIPCII